MKRGEFGNAWTLARCQKIDPSFALDVKRKPHMTDEQHRERVFFSASAVVEGRKYVLAEKDCDSRCEKSRESNVLQQAVENYRVLKNWPR